MTVLLLEPVSFSGIESRAKAKLRNLICTLKTAQPDGKHLVKKPVAKLWKQSMRAEMRTILQLVSGYSNQSKTLTATQIVTIKLLRAQGGCHGTGRRRKTW